MYILYAHHNDSYIKMSASTFSLVTSLTLFCNALYLRAVLIRYFLLFPCLYVCNNPCFQHLKKRCSQKSKTNWFFKNILFLRLFTKKVVIPKKKGATSFFRCYNINFHQQSCEKITITINYKVIHILCESF